MKKYYTLKELENITGVNVQTLRNWNKKELIEEIDMFGEHKLFDSSTIETINKIVELKKQGYKLHNIKIIIESENIDNELFIIEP